MKLSKIALIANVSIIGISFSLVIISSINPTLHLLIKNMVMMLVGIICLTVSIGLLAMLLYGLFLLYGIFYLAVHDNSDSAKHVNKSNQKK